MLLPGYYYDLDESYDESDEEEVKAHLRRVTEQPPLKLDTSSEVCKCRKIFIPDLKLFFFLFSTNRTLSKLLSLQRKWISSVCVVSPR